MISKGRENCKAFGIKDLSFYALQKFYRGTICHAIFAP